jgi:hypothetical protein
MAHSAVINISHSLEGKNRQHPQDDTAAEMHCAIHHGPDHGRVPQRRRDIVEQAASIAAPSANPTPGPATVAVTAMVLETMPKGFSGFGGRGNGSMAFPPHSGKLMYSYLGLWKGGICCIVYDYRLSQLMRHRKTQDLKVETGWAQVQCFANLPCFGYLRRSEVCNPACAFEKYFHQMGSGLRVTLDRVQRLKRGHLPFVRVFAKMIKKAIELLSGLSTGPLQ